MKVLSKVLILDEMGYLPMTHEKLACSSAWSIATKSESAPSWPQQVLHGLGNIFGEQVIATVILDRLLHHSTTLSCRLKDSVRPDSCRT